ncbi:MAG: LysR family transcriptional regulator [Reyranella sp.]|nr:LysR family transcriptional regulator [Reyranella sp.]
MGHKPRPLPVLRDAALRAAPQGEVALTARDLLALQAFELAARTGSFKAAAEQLHVTSSAISHRIAGLERRLGAKLFERGPRGVVLAPAGHALASTTGRAFGDLARALARQGAGSRRLRVSAVPIFATHFLLPRIGQFIAQHPEIEVQVEASMRMADMEAGLIDVALRYGDGHFPGVAAEKVMDLAAVPVGAPALVKRLRLRTPADLVRAPQVRVSPFGASWSEWAEGAGLDPEAFERPGVQGGQKSIQLDGMGQALRAAAHGLGIALAFEPLVDSEIASGALVKLGPAVPTRGQIWFVCRPQDRGLPAIRALRRWMQAELSAMKDA